MSRREDVFKNFLKYESETKERVHFGIEQYRKGTVRLTVKDQSGKPVPGAALKIRQKNHEFLHGANLFMLDEMETEEKNEAYRDSFKEVFNLATLPFYWMDLEPEEGKPRFAKDSPKVYRRPAPDLCLEYCEQNHIAPKEHCLTYLQFTPKWVDASNIFDVKAKLEKRYRELAERYAHRILDWEVINETLCVGETNDRLAFFRDPEVVEWNFALARKYFPYNKLIINEAGHVWHWGGFAYNRSAYYQQIERALGKGSDIDCVGMQFHVFDRRENEINRVQDMYNPQMLYRVLDQYTKLGKPIQITEITIPSYSDDPEDELIQAELIERLYEIWFSHEAVEAAIYWNLVDGYAFNAVRGDMKAGENYFYGGLLRFDLSEKPAFTALRKLFHEKWITNTEAATDDSGYTSFRGFYGEYEIEVKGKTQSIKATKNGPNEFEIII